MPNTLIIHVVPLQVSVSGSTVCITCDDPRARIVNEEIEFNLTPLGPGELHAKQRVRFVVQDPSDPSGSDKYLDMSSGPLLGDLVAWKRKGGLSRSPKLRAGQNIQVVAVAYRGPRGGAQASEPVKLGRGERRIRIRGTGGDGDIKY